MRLALGTVQFGRKYGIANPDGKVVYDEVARILEYANSKHIDTLDTAAVYGDSEAVLGRIGVSDWKIITKIAPINANVVDVETWVMSQVHESMKRLNVDHVYGVLLHRPADLLGDKATNYIKALNKLKKSGDINKIGYSIYAPLELNELTNLLWPDIVQTPYNVFDQRISSSGWLDKLASRGTLVHARSVFLQGLLLMPRDRRHPYFSRWDKQFNKWDSLLSNLKVSAHAAALNFVLNDSRIEKVIVGVDGSSQLAELVDVMAPSISFDCHKLACNDTELIEPYRWKLA